jgi:predicted NBD/HSP70 family sugar kinase
MARVIGIDIGSAGAVTALRRGAARQRKIAEVHGDRAGDAAVAGRIAETLAELADEFERDLVNKSPI